VREACNRDQYQKRLAIWLTFIGPFHAHQVATLLGVSKQAVWLWVGQYNRHGPKALARQGRGGRRWAYLSWEQEEAFLAGLREGAQKGRVLTASQMRSQLCQATGKPVSLGYVYRLLHRHRWPVTGPRFRRAKSNPQRQEAFGKNFSSSSRKR
jgi:transposase